MMIKYIHTNIISNNWRALAGFYIKALNCSPIFPERDLSGVELAKATDIEKPHLNGIHLQLPGYDENGPTLEIFEYVNSEDKHLPVANRQGIQHIAFHVDDIEGYAHKILESGGKPLGHKGVIDIEGVGELSFQYLRDPEDNIIEIQCCV